MCVSLNTLILILVILAIIALALWIFGRRPWVHR